MIDLERNHVVEAGAGTGKTYALVQALLQALFQKGIPLPNIVALTFTKKAAGEMKERIADELRRILLAKTIPEAFQSWGHRLEELQEKARTAFEQIDRANISTIHAFAFSLLKRYPLLARINPDAEVDEKGIRYAEFFDLEWPRFLSIELAESSPHAADWLEIFEKLSLSDIEEVARLLCDFEVPLRSLPISDDQAAENLTPIHSCIRDLVAAHGIKDKTGRLVAACEEILGAACANDKEKITGFSDEILADLRLDAGKTKAWGSEDVRQVKMAQKICQNLLAHGDRIICLLTTRIKPFLSHFRSTVLAQGYLSHSALLALAASLVRHNHDVRHQLQREFRMIFIDEFQDTDPRQGELLLFLAERTGGHAKSWRDVLLEPGKLFVVGDPKQSIYRFRGADISAYRQISDLVIRQGGMSIPLQKSWRSHEQIIQVINHAFSQIISEKGHISPAYTPLESLRQREGLPLQTVELVLARSGGTQTSSEAQEKEAPSVASWITSHVGTAQCRDRTGSCRPLMYRDIALIFRSTAAMRPFVESLRNVEIPFVVEGERYFYSTPEVTDLVNFLRVIENPHDALALVGLLRSPLGGFTDVEILDLREAKGLDASLPLPDHFSASHQELWKILSDLHARVGRVPLKALLKHLFEKSFILELAARSYHHDQTLANVLKLRRLLETFAEDGNTSLRALLSKVRRYMDNDRLEGESPLADESYDAVRLLTIHKAKGLEFPVVILPSLHSGRRKGQSDPLTYDWSSGRLGLRVGNLQNLEKFFLDNETQERELEEEKRVLYVAMTRARERLVLSGGVGLIRPSGESYLEWLREALGLVWAQAVEGRFVVGETSIDIRFVTEQPLARPAPTLSTPNAALQEFDATPFADLWRERSKTLSAYGAQPAVITPSASTRGDPITDQIRLENDEKRGRPERARMLGTLLHLFLERWDFGCEKCSMPAQLRHAANRYFARLGLLREPLPDPKLPDAVYTFLDPMHEVLSITKEAQGILADFIGSPAFEEIQLGAVLAREMPFVDKSQSGALVRGSVDILYRTLDGTLAVGDYKTQTAGSDQQTQKSFISQGRLYCQAVEKALKEKPIFKVIDLREGVAFSLDLEPTANSAILSGHD